MPATWKQLSFIPSSAALQCLREGWSWLIPESLSAFMCASSGDVFLEAEDQSIHWLDTGQGRLTRVAESREEFLSALREDNGAEWLLAPVIDQLLDSGKSLAPDQCFAYKVMPILGGTYTVDNMVPMSASKWYGFSGYVHSQIKDLPDGAHISFTIGEV
ncbi:MAG: DUF1851 domain-containing protein [Burkholderiaceae bacterium]|nr:MAG: DUF1851 domain-containing protein [Burkholderiaceae bacterium]